MVHKVYESSGACADFWDQSLGAASTGQGQGQGPGGASTGQGQGQTNDDTAGLLGLSVMGAQPELKVPLKVTAAARVSPVSGTSSSASRSSASVPELGGDSPVPVSSSSASVLELGGDVPVPGSSSSASVPELPELKVPLKDTAAALPAEDPEVERRWRASGTTATSWE